MTDRDQIRRDAEWILNDSEPYEYPNETVKDLARHCLALLAELEQAERERDGAQLALESSSPLILDLERKIIDYEAKLAKVPALVEALERIADHQDHEDDHLPASTLARKADEALADWNENQGGQ